MELIVHKLSKKALFSLVSLTFALVSTGYGFKGAGVLPVCKDPNTGEELLLVGSFKNNKEKYYECRQFGGVVQKGLRKISDPYKDTLLEEVAKLFNIKTRNAFAQVICNIGNPGIETLNKTIFEKLKSSDYFLSTDKSYIVYKLRLDKFVVARNIHWIFDKNKEHYRKRGVKYSRYFNWIKNKTLKVDNITYGEPYNPNIKNNLRLDPNFVSTVFGKEYTDKDMGLSRRNLRKPDNYANQGDTPSRKRDGSPENYSFSNRSLKTVNEKKWSKKTRRGRNNPRRKSYRGNSKKRYSNKKSSSEKSTFSFSRYSRNNESKKRYRFKQQYAPRNFTPDNTKKERAWSLTPKNLFEWEENS
jgi:hypothetical protein